MKHKFAILITLMLLLTAMLAGCTLLSSTPSPPASQYPADISAYVTLADKIMVNQQTITPPTTYQAASGAKTPIPDINRYGIVEATARNKEYTNPITQTGWALLNTFGNAQLPPSFTSPTSIPKGQTGTIMLVFQLMGGGGTVNPNGMKLCYSGQQPPSYATLAFHNGDLPINNKVDLYNWDSKKGTQTQTQAPQKNIATIGPLGMQVGTDFAGHALLLVDIKPNDSALANKVYEVDLYEKGQFRAKTTVAWNQPEINVSTSKTVGFPITGEEYNAYLFKDVSNIFSVKVHE